MTLTIYFDSGFWYGLVEYESITGDYRAFKYCFGQEPKDNDIWNFTNNKLTYLIERNDCLLKNSSHSTEFVKPIKKINPKRMQRKINKEKLKPVVSTKAQLAINESRTEIKTLSKANKKAKKEELRVKKFQKKQEKKLRNKKGH